MAEENTETHEVKKVRRVKKRVQAAPKAPEPSAKTVNVYALDGSVDRSVDVPKVFAAEYRPDLIRRAVLAYRANRRQAYGSGRRSGLRHSVRWSGKGQGVSRVPRIRGTMTGAQAPGTRGGRRAHPPKVERIWALKVNFKERRKARDSALAAVCDPERVRSRGHRFNPNMTLPLVVVDKIEEMSNTKETLKVLESLGVIDDVTRSRDRTKIRAGKGKMRGRRYREPKSFLLVVSSVGSVRRGFGNLPGVEFTTPEGLNTEMLAPGGDPGRLTIFSAAAFEKLRSW